MGQIYIPAVNWMLLAVVSAAVVGFGSSTRLASAYGVAVMGTMLVTTFLTFFVIRFRWGYPLWLCVLVTGCFMLVDLTFFAAAMHKVLEGGWFPLLLGATVFTVMMTWQRGREIAARAPAQRRRVPLESFLRVAVRLAAAEGAGHRRSSSPRRRTPRRTPCCTASSTTRSCTSSNVFLTVEFRDVPWVAPEERVTCEALGHDCWRVIARYGFMDRPTSRRPRALRARMACSSTPWTSPTSCRARRSSPSRAAGGMALWRERVFAAMARNAGSVSDYFNIPTNRVVELGTQVEI